MRDNSGMESPLETPKAKHRWGRTWPTLAAALLFVGLSFAVWLLPELLVEWSLRPSSPGVQNGIDGLNGVERTKAVTDTRQGVLFAAGGLIAIISLVITWLRHRIDRAKQDLDRDSYHRGRYAQASEQLGHERPAVRLAGVYAMAALADDWQAVDNIKQQKVCVDVLCAYLRMSYVPGSEIAKSGEKEVRLTIIKSITERLEDPASPRSWSNLSLDFTGAVFDGGDFTGAKFTGGNVSFASAKFTSGNISFASTEFTGGNVSFSNAEFTGGSVSFVDAQFTSKNVSFSQAQFTGGNVHFIGAEFTGENVSFASAKFTSGNISFNSATFTSENVNFASATFTSENVSFIGAQFTKGNVSFSYAQFTGGSVSFVGAEFAGGNISFVGAEFAGGNVHFNNAKFTGGNVSFNGISGVTPGFLDFNNPGAWVRPPSVPWSDGETPPWVSPDVWPPALAP